MPCTNYALIDKRKAIRLYSRCARGLVKRKTAISPEHAKK